MRDGEPNIYGALATMRNGYTQMQWTRVQMFLVFNTVAIPLVLGSASTSAIKLFISVAAIVVHLAVMHATLRADHWLKFFDERMVEFEGLDADNENGTRVRVFSHPGFDTRRHSWLASRRFFGFVGIAALVFWIWQFINQIHAISH